MVEFHYCNTDLEAYFSLQQARKKDDPKYKWPVRPRTTVLKGRSHCLGRRPFVIWYSNSIGRFFFFNTSKLSEEMTCNYNTMTSISIYF